MMRKNRIDKRNKLKIFLIIGSIICVALFLKIMISGRKLNTNPDKIINYKGKYEIIVNGESLSGLYEGEYKNNAPDGIGTFITDNNSFTYEGSWKNGVFSGKGIIIYENGNKEEGSFKNGKKQGPFYVYLNKNEHQQLYYNEDVPYGYAAKYKNNKLITEEWYTNGDTISNIIRKAKILDYKTAKTNKYANQYLKITGEVLFSEEDDDNTYFRIKTNSIGTAIGSFMNTNHQNSNPVLIPKFKEKQIVTLYGYYTGMQKDLFMNDLNAFNNMYVGFQPIYGEIEDTDDMDLSEHRVIVYEKSLLDDSIPYTELCRYAPFFTGKSFENTVKVIKVIQKNQDFYLFCHILNEPSKNIYVLHYKGSITDTFFTDSILRVNGFHDGTYKALYAKQMASYQNYFAKLDKKELNTNINTFDYNHYPYIEINNIKYNF